MKKNLIRKYLISPCPLNLGAKFLHALMQAAVAAKLGLNSRQVGAPLSLIHPPLVFLQPAQQILNVTYGDLIHFRPHPQRGLLQDLGGLHLSHGDLCGRHT